MANTPNLLDLGHISSTAPSTDMVENNLGAGDAYTFKGQVYNQQSPSIPRELAIRHLYGKQRAEALANGANAAELPSLRQVLQTDKSQRMEGKEGVMTLKTIERAAPEGTQPLAEMPTDPAGRVETTDPDGLPPGTENRDPVNADGSGEPSADDSEDAGAVAEGVAEDAVALEEQFPHVGKLRANGIHNYGQLRQAKGAEGGLASLDGIADARAQEIEKVLDSRSGS